MTYLELLRVAHIGLDLALRGSRGRLPRDKLREFLRGYLTGAVSIDARKEPEHQASKT